MLVYLCTHGLRSCTYQYNIIIHATLTNLCVSVEFFNWVVLDKAHPSHHFNTSSGNIISHLIIIIKIIPLSLLFPSWGGTMMLNIWHECTCIVRLTSFAPSSYNLRLHFSYWEASSFLAGSRHYSPLRCST